MESQYYILQLHINLLSYQNKKYKNKFIGEKLLTQPSCHIVALPLYGVAVLFGKNGLLIFHQLRASKCSQKTQVKTNKQNPSQSKSTKCWFRVWSQLFPAPDPSFVVCRPVTPFMPSLLGCKASMQWSTVMCAYRYMGIYVYVFVIQIFPPD